MGRIVVFLKVTEEGIHGGSCWLLEQGHPAMHVGRLRLHLTLKYSPLLFYSLEGLIMFPSGLIGSFQFPTEMYPQP